MSDENPTYREPDPNKSETTAAPEIEDGLRDVLIVLKPFDYEDTTAIILAVAALWDLPLVRKST